MDSFLHSEAWLAFQQAAGNHPFWHEGQVYLAHGRRLASYISGSRVKYDASSTLPPTYSKTFLRLEPVDETSLEQIRRMSEHPLVPTFSVQPRQTSIVKIKADQEQQIAAWSSKHRYNLRLAQKKGVVIQTFSANAPVEFERFWSLLSDTATRQGFRTHQRDYYRKMVDVLCPLGKAHLLISTYEGHDLAAMLFITDGITATYLHGASADAHKEVMAPFPLHLQAIDLAREAGCTYYDLWGTDAVRDENGHWIPQEGAGSYGVTRFKLGFGGDIVEYPGAYDVVIHPARYRFYTILRTLKGGKRSFH